jgi:hypothetical protein
MKMITELNQRRAPTLSAFFASAWLSLASTSFGHPGHETLPIEPQSAAHHLLEPSHALPAIVMGTTVVLTLLIVRRFLKIMHRTSR